MLSLFNWDKWFEQDTSKCKKSNEKYFQFVKTASWIKNIVSILKSLKHKKRFVWTRKWERSIENWIRSFNKKRSFNSIANLYPLGKGKNLRDDAWKICRRSES
jgi:hypothetical protein